MFAVDETADIIIKSAAEKEVEELNESLRESKQDAKYLQQRVYMKDVEIQLLNEKLLHFTEQVSHEKLKVAHAELKVESSTKEFSYAKESLENKINHM